MNFQPVRHIKYLGSFNFSSLTDIVMQLLIFFLLTFSFANIRGVNVTLPKATMGQPPHYKSISVTIDKDKKLYVNGEYVNKDQLADRVAVLLQKEANQQVVVRADKDIILQDVIEVFDMAKRAGATRLFIATEFAKEVK